MFHPPTLRTRLIGDRPRSSGLVVVLVTALSFAAPASGAVRPVLSVARDAPLTVRGTHFRARENVTITVLMGAKKLSRATRAGRTGDFTVRFLGIRLDRCATPLRISARRASGVVVRARLPIPECAQP
jgi:hypothetical protein